MIQSDSVWLMRSRDGPISVLYTSPQPPTSLSYKHMPPCLAFTWELVLYTPGKNKIINKTKSLSWTQRPQRDRLHQSKNGTGVSIPDKNGKWGTTVCG